MLANQEDLQLRLAEVEKRERDLARRERALKATGLRGHPYARLKNSPRMVDAVIIVCALAIAALVVAGAVMDGPSRNEAEVGAQAFVEVSRGGR